MAYIPLLFPTEPPRQEIGLQEAFVRGLSPIGGLPPETDLLHRIPTELAWFGGASVVRRALPLALRAAGIVPQVRLPAAVAEALWMAYLGARHTEAATPEERGREAALWATLSAVVPAARWARAWMRQRGAARAAAGPAIQAAPPPQTAPLSAQEIAPPPRPALPEGTFTTLRIVSPPLQETVPTVSETATAPVAQASRIGQQAAAMRQVAATPPGAASVMDPMEKALSSVSGRALANTVTKALQEKFRLQEGTAEAAFRGMITDAISVSSQAPAQEVRSLWTSIRNLKEASPDEILAALGRRMIPQQAPPLRGRMRMLQLAATSEEAMQPVFSRVAQNLTIGDLKRVWQEGAFEDMVSRWAASFDDVRDVMIRRVGDVLGGPVSVSKEVTASGLRPALQAFFESLPPEIESAPARTAFLPALSDFLANTTDAQFTSAVESLGTELAKETVARILEVPTSVVERLPVERLKRALLASDAALRNGASVMIARQAAVQQLGFPSLAHLLLPSRHVLESISGWSRAAESGNPSHVLASALAKKFAVDEVDIWSFASEAASQMLREPSDIVVALAARAGLPVETIMDKVGRNAFRRVVAKLGREVAEDPTVKEVVKETFRAPTLPSVTADDLRTMVGDVVVTEEGAIAGRLRAATRVIGPQSSEVAGTLESEDVRAVYYPLVERIMETARAAKRDDRGVALIQAMDTALSEGAPKETVLRVLASVERALSAQGPPTERLSSAWKAFRSVAAATQPPIDPQKAVAAMFRALKPRVPLALAREARQEALDALRGGASYEDVFRTLRARLGV